MSESTKQTPTILVVEDDPGDFNLVKVYLRKAELGQSDSAESVVWSKTLEEGITATRSTAPDVILLDLSLPDSSGLATVQAMRAVVPDVPIIVLTGQDETALALATLEAGAKDYLIKGQFDHEALGRAVRYAQVRGKLEQRLVLHQQHLEELVKERTIELARALEVAQAANRAKGAFLANMNHEIRTPMNAIMGMTSLLVRGNTDPRQLDRLAKIDSAARHLMEILSDVLDMATIEAGKVTLQDREFDPVSMLHEVQSLLESQAGAKGLSIELECDSALPARLMGDALRIRQVLVNLVSNGVKFTEHGVITLSAQLLSCGAEGEDSAQVRFTVADTGIGIAAKDIERIFGTFEQADNSHTRVHGGTGLGLAISRNLVELMGSQIEISSVPGAGSTFSFAVRLKLPSPAARATETKSATASSSLTGARILVADDEMMNLEILRELLLMEGVKVDLAADGGQVVDLARRNAYDLILMDLQMPVMDGPEAAVLIRQIPHHATTPIVALTSDALADTRKQCLEAGMNDQIGKPFDPDHLIACIDKWLQASRSPTPAPRA